MDSIQKSDLTNASPNVVKSTMSTNLTSIKPLNDNFRAINLSKGIQEQIALNLGKFQRNSQDTEEIRATYDIYEEIGRGSFGQVRRAEHRETGQQVALKIINLAKMSHYERNQVR